MNRTHRSQLPTIVALITIAIASASAQQAPYAEPRARFVPNAGQVIDDSLHARPDIHFTARSSGLLLYFQSDRISYVFRKVAGEAPVDLSLALDPGHAADDTVTTYRFDMEIVGARDEVIPEGLDPSDEYLRYYLPQKPGGVRVTPHRSLIYRDIYPAIDLRYTSTESGYKYDFIVRPGGRVGDIRLRYIGAQGVRHGDGGEITITTPLGDLVESAPVSFLDGDEAHPVSSAFRFDGDVIRVDVERYDTSRALVIDPSIVWSTYCGGSDVEGTINGTYGSLAVARDGSSVMSGYSNGTNFPTSAGALQTTSGGTVDAVLVRFRRNGTRVWATYVGGGSMEYVGPVAVDVSGNIYHSGYTASSDFPVTAAAHQTSRSSATDSYLVKLDSSGGMIWSTYYGGASSEYITSVAVDSLGNPTLVAATISSGMATSGAFQSSLTGNSYNTVVARFTSSGSLLWATYLGEAYPVGAAVDVRGNIYLCGHTSSNVFPLTAGAFQTTRSGWNDAFVASFDSTGRQRWATLLGGGSNDVAYGIATGADSNVVVVGHTYSSNFPTSTGAFQTTHAGDADGFVTSFTARGALRWSTLYGGTREEIFVDVDVDRSGNVVVGGWTTGLPPLTSDEIPAPRGAHDILLVHFDSTGTRDWASRLGGSGSELGGWIAFDRNALMVWLSTGSWNIPVTAGAFQGTMAGSPDLYLARVCGFTASVTASGPLTLCPEDSVVLTAPTVDAVVWSTGSTARSIVVREPGRYWFHATDDVCSDYSDTVTVTRITATAQITPSGALRFCDGGAVTLDGGDGHRAYSWSNGETGREITVRTSGSYRLAVVGANGCRAYDTIDVVVWPLPRPAATASALVFCPGDSVTLELPAGYRSYSWSTLDTVRRIVVRSPGTYRYSVVDSNGCRGPIQSIVIAQHARPVGAVSPATAVICPGDSLTLTAPPGFVGYAWSTGETTQSIRVVASGNYDVIVTDTNGCRSLPATARVRLHPRPDVRIVSSRTTICDGDSALLYSSRFAASYRWSTGATTSFIHATAPGRYTLTIVDSNGCRATATIDVVIRPAPVARIVVDGSAQLCAGEDVALHLDGFASVAWSNGGIGPSIRVRQSGRYWAEVIDAGGCRGYSDTVDVVVHDRPRVAMTGPFEVCRGSEATYAATMIDGVVYRWSIIGVDGALVGGVDSADAHVRWGTQAGTIVLIVEDIATGCRDTLRRDVVVGDRVRPVITQLPSATLCGGDSVVLDAGPGYRRYRWTNGEQSQRLEVRAPGRYAVWVETDAGCAGTSDTIDVRAGTQPAPVVRIEGSPMLCPGTTVRLSTGEYASYTWSTGEQTRTIDVSRAGSYSVVVRDSNGCLGASSNITVAEAKAPVVDVVGPRGGCRMSTATYCATDTTLADFEWIVDGGTIVSGAGSACVVIRWDSIAGGVRLRARDAATGCSGASDPLAVDLSSGIVPPLHVAAGSPCRGDTVVLDAGAGYASYRWSTGETSRTIRVTDDGTYDVAVSDTSGCSGGGSIEIVFGDRPVVTIDVDSGDCASGRQLDAGAGHARYLWSTGDTTRTIRAFVDGVYSVEVASASGCIATASVDVILPAAPTVSITPSGSLSLCRGDSVEIVAQPGLATYRWSTGETTRAIVVRSAGTYRVEVTDDRGCRGLSDALDVRVVDPPAVTIVRRGDSLHATPGGVDYRWMLDGRPIAGAAGSSIPAAAPGRYGVTLTDTSGCSSTASIDVSGASELLLSLDTVTAAVGDRFFLTLSATSPDSIGVGWRVAIRYPARSLFVHDVTGVGSVVAVTRVAPGTLLLESSGPLPKRSAIARLELEGLATAVPVNPIEFISAEVAGGIAPATADGLVLLTGCSAALGEAFGRAVSIVSITPNPASAQLTVRLRAPAGATVELRLRDVAGREAFASSIAASGDEDEMTLDVSDVASGLYVLELRDRGERDMVPVVIAR